MSVAPAGQELHTGVTPVVTEPAEFYEVVFACHGFPPEFHSGVFRSAAFAKYLPVFGVTPLILTASDWRAGPISYGQFAWEQAHGQAITRCEWLRPTPFILRAFERLPVLSSVSRLLKRHAVGARVAHAFIMELGERRPRLVYASSPPVEALYAGQVLAARLKLPFVADLRDPWSYSFNNRYRSGLDHMLDRREERRLLTKAACVIANTEGQKKILVKKVGIPRSRVRVITNGADVPLFSVATPFRRLLPEGVFNIAHIGVTAHAEPTAVGRQYRAVRCDESARSLRFIRDALLDIFERRTELVGAVRLNIIGEAQSNKFQYLEPLNEHITYHGPVSHAAALDAMSQADLLLLLQIEYRLPGLAENPIVPAKMYDYLQSGTAVLGALQEGDAARTLRPFPGTIVVAPRDTAAIARHIECHCDAWRRRGRSERYVRDLRLYQRKHLTGELAALFGAVLAEEGRKERSAAGAPTPALALRIGPQAR